MKKRVLISSIFSSNTINPLLLKLSPTDLILVVEKDLDKLKGKNEMIKKEAIKKLMDNFGGTLNIEKVETASIYNLYEIAKSVTDKIDTLGKSDIFINITEGRKTLAFGMYFAGYSRRKKINGIYYLIEETNELVKMPFPNFHISKFQKDLLKILEKKEKTIKDLREKSERTKSVFYKYLKELEEDGYVEIEENKVEITELGRILLL